MGELIEQGGPVVWPLLVLAAFGLLLSLERFFTFHRSRVNVGDLLIGLGAHLRKKAFAEARHEASRAPGPVARVAHAILLRHELPRQDLRDIAQEAGQLEVPRLERNLRGIMAVAMVSPLLGMLGTVLGLAQTFMKMRDAGGITTTADLSAGIFQALVTTALGLTIAIPMYLLYLYFYARGKRLLHRIERGGIEMVNLVIDARGESDIVDLSEARKEDLSKGARKS